MVEPIGAPNLCLVPRPMPVREAERYRKLRALHCDRKRESHDCSGRMIIDRNGVTLTCPLCGDARKAYPKELAQP